MKIKNNINDKQVYSVFLILWLYLIKNLIAKTININVCNDNNMIIVFRLFPLNNSEIDIYKRLIKIFNDLIVYRSKLIGQ